MMVHPSTVADDRLRQQIIAAARAWIGTPYQHQASCQGAGCDCLGLIRGVWRMVYGTEPEAIPAYTPDWSEASNIERLRDAAERNLIRIPQDNRKAGDVLLFRMRDNSPAKHLGIMSSTHHMIHAYTNHGVLESSLGTSWSRRIAYVYAFPKP